MSYTGTSTDDWMTDGWVTAALFEVPAGPLGWMNGIQTCGYGFWRGDGAEYFYYALR